ncbi:MAG: efflux RND transporter periplasmic adaptor subunit [Candidatus Aegiribacteria sp.]|nr:efflux RND transporter periplasmic adaptor subunit [Candidatus Aegiribacteria sp.]
MKRVISYWVPVTSIFALILLVSFTIAGCHDSAAEYLHVEESTGCSTDDGHDHGTVEAHVELEEDHVCHDHEADGVHSDIEDDHDGHDHEAESCNENHDQEEAVKLVLSRRNLDAAGIELAVAGPGSVDQHTQLFGEISLNNDRMSHIVPPVAGIVEEIRVQIGDQVRAGDVLAVLSSRDLAEARTEYLRAREKRTLASTIYSNQQELYDNAFLSEQDYLISRQEYTDANIGFQAARHTLNNLGLSDSEINSLSSGGLLTRQELRAPISGTVVHLDFDPGEIVGNDVTVLTVADLSSVWVDLDVLQTDLGSVRAGQSLTVSASEIDIPEATTSLDFVSPVIDRSTRTARARAELPNPHGHWMPGLFVTAHVASTQSEAPVVVHKESVQSLDGETVVFVPLGDAFETLPVVLGRSNRTHVEIEAGLRQGDRYVSKGAFALKAEMVTSGLDSHAGHGH